MSPCVCERPISGAQRSAGSEKKNIQVIIPLILLSQENSWETFSICLFFLDLMLNLLFVLTIIMAPTSCTSGHGQLFVFTEKTIYHVKRYAIFNR